MNPVKTRNDVEKTSKQIVESLYGAGIRDFKVRELFPLPEKGPQTAWDAQVTFLSNNLKYTVDLEIQMNTGEITNARLIDTMVPL